MGVPSFYRWLVGKYPKVVMEAKEDGGDGVDASLPNPNGVEFDNLYLDMNGIIHPCFHPNDQVFPPSTFDEVFQSIFSYIDRIFRIVRPRKLLYMAIDGVAPRAKMNQQRSGRYLASKVAEFAEAEEERLRKQFQAEGRQVLPKQESETSDSNVISPGTVFMEKLSRALEYYVRRRLNNDLGWKELKVILSDANVPGEGEHKIMSFIRLQRNLPGYDPNTVHCLHGLDADLIMLALATHEMHFTILREDVLRQQTMKNIILPLEATLSKAEYEALKAPETFGQLVKMKRQGCPNKPYEFLKIWALRKYLELDLSIPDPPFELDLERLIDDFIFMCFFTGNDFLPHIPSIEMHEGAIDLLISVYKSEFKKIGGYLIDTSRMKDKKAAYIKAKHVERFILAVASFEEKIFEKRQKMWQRNLQKRTQERLETMWDDSESLRYPTHESTCPPVHNEQYNYASGSVAYVRGDGSDVTENTKALIQTLKDILREKSDLFKHGSLNDSVRLGFPGWRGRYYEEKFCLTSSEEIENLRKQLVMKYTEGLCWVLQYYFAGVCSWNWFYPFHYGPFASDIKGLSCSSVRFTLGEPFKPFDQLMAVLPPRSGHALPKAFQHLMADPQSRLKEFYPTEFDVDVDGKRYLWQGIVKLPFVKEGLLINETRKLESELDEDEQRRNSIKQDKMFVSRSHVLGKAICSLYHSHSHLSEKGREQMNIPMDCNVSGGMNGFLCLSGDKPDGCYFPSPVKEMADIMDDHVVSALYKNPENHDHVPRLLENVTMPPEHITESDMVQRKLWHEHDGRPVPQPCRGNYRHHHNNLTSAVGVGSRSESRASSGIGREVCKAAGAGWGGRGRGAEGFTKIQAADWGVPRRPAMGRSRGVHGGAADGYAAAGRGRDDGGGEGAAFWPSAGASPGGAGGSWSGARAAPAAAAGGRGGSYGRGLGGELCGEGGPYKEQG